MDFSQKMNEEFKTFLEETQNEKFKTPLEIPINIWGNPGWELLKKKQIEETMLPFIKHNITRAQKTMPIYTTAYARSNFSKNASIEDFYSIPLLVKDAAVGGISFREKINKNPYCMLPKDIKKPCQIYKSGGTKGVATPTFITVLDREIESTAFARGSSYLGIGEGDIVLSTYNPTHKGGEEIKEAILKNKASFIQRRTTDSAAETIKTIKMYQVNSIVTSQGPLDKGDKEAKGGGVDLLSLIEAGSDILEQQIEKIILGGYLIIDEVIEWAETSKKNVGSLLGSSEAIPQAGSTFFSEEERLCKYNNLHLLNGPHYMEILKHESGAWIPVKKGETGILVYTTIAREGTIYIRYAPGDQATLLANECTCDCGIKSPIISNIKRIDNPSDIASTGCCVG
ncbi:MAG: hypothetical protein Q7R70_05545 [Candidatus Diapherotrites archaeon]|nr:hypothetical protein [Candidatus Diapherotrites archaeon]